MTNPSHQSQFPYSEWTTSVRGRLARGMSANVFGQIVTIGIQLFSLPILIRAWGIEAYGIWLVILAIPTYLVFLDIGFGTAAGTEMVAQVVRGNTGEAIRTFHSLTLLVVLAVLGIGGPIILFALFFPWSDYFNIGVYTGNLNFTIASACAYGLVSLLMSVAAAGFRANGSYALCAALSHALRAIESAAMLAAATLGQNLAVAVAILTGTRIVGTTAIIAIMHLKITWLTFSLRGASLSNLRLLVRPAVAVMLFPAAFSISLQGMTLLIAAVLSVKAVVVFSAIRTLTRLGLQAVSVVTQAIVPEYSAAAHTDRARLGRLVLFNIVAAIGIAFVAAIGLLVGGPWFIGYWSAGKIDASLSLIALMSALMIVQALGTVPLNLLISVNRHAVSGIVMFSGALITLTGAATVLPAFGLNGAATVLLLIETVMLVVYFDQVAKSGLLDIKDMQQQILAGRAIFK